MFNRIVFFWKIGCLGALLGLPNWYVYKEALPQRSHMQPSSPFWCFRSAFL